MRGRTGACAAPATAQFLLLFFLVTRRPTGWDGRAGRVARALPSPRASTRPPGTTPAAVAGVPMPVPVPVPVPVPSGHVPFAASIAGHRLGP
ncbi:hypothetical protein ACFVXQ_30130, partial [Kitasatospora sp. NPDC058263]